MNEATRIPLPSRRPTRPAGRVLAMISVAALAAVVAALLAAGGGAPDHEVAATSAADDAPAGGGQLEQVSDEPADDLFDDVPVVTYDVHLARDPFEPVRDPEPDVVDPDPDEPAPDDPDPDEPDPDDPDPVDPDDPDAPEDKEPEDPRCVGEEERVCNGRVVSLLAVNEVDGELVAEIQVDETIYGVRRHQTFATQFKLLDIEAECATIEFASETFRQCVGEHVLK